MRVRMMAPLWVCVLVACNPAAENPPVVAPSVVVVPAQDRSVSVNVPAPSAVKVLQDVYGVTFKNVGGERLDSGVWAGYWSDGRVPGAAAQPVFVALTAQTPGPEQEHPKDTDPVLMSGALYQLDASGQWQLQAVQKAFGRFGVREQPPIPGESTSSVWLPVGATRVIWAVPTVVPAMGGAHTDAYELVGVDWGQGQLSYLGAMPAGESGPVDCQADAPPNAPQACYGWTVQLSLSSGAGAAATDWPTLTVQRSGSRYDDASRSVVKVNDSGVYAFDASRGGYVARQK